MTGTFIVAPTVRRPERAPESTSSAPSSEKGRLGKRVVPKSENFTRDFHEAIRPDSRNAPTATSRTAGIAFSWGTESFSKKDYDRATAHFSTAIQFDPENAFAYQYRGIAWAKKKEYDRAIADYSEAIRLVPTDPKAYYNRGITWVFKNEYAKAIADLDVAIRLDPRDALAYFARGQAWYYLGRFHKAIADFSAAIRIRPRYPRAYYRRGLAYKGLGEFTKAIADLSEAIRLGPGQADTYFERGCARSAKREYDQAIADFNEAIRLDPRDTWAYFNRGIAWAAKKEYDKALADLDRAIGIDPRNTRALFNRATISFSTRRKGVNEDIRAVLDREDWRDPTSIYAVLLGYFAARRANQEPEGRSLLDQAQARCDHSAWPFPIVEYLRGALEETAVLSKADADEKKATAHCFLGLDRLQKGQADAAKAHFLWVKEHGEMGAFTIAVAELDRMTGQTDRAKAP